MSRHQLSQCCSQPPSEIELEKVKDLGLGNYLCRSCCFTMYPCCFLSFFSQLFLLAISPFLLPTNLTGSSTSDLAVY